LRHGALRNSSQDDDEFHLLERVSKFICEGHKSQDPDIPGCSIPFFEMFSIGSFSTLSESSADLNVSNLLNGINDSSIKNLHLLPPGTRISYQTPGVMYDPNVSWIATKLHEVFHDYKFIYSLINCRLS
jgi:hypothetical protein